MPSFCFFIHLTCLLCLFTSLTPNFLTLTPLSVLSILCGHKVSYSDLNHRWFPSTHSIHFPTLLPKLPGKLLSLPCRSTYNRNLTQPALRGEEETGSSVWNSQEYSQIYATPSKKRKVMVEVSEWVTMSMSEEH